MNKIMQLQIMQLLYLHVTDYLM